jgi:hypothetical protein
MPVPLVADDAKHSEQSIEREVEAEPSFIRGDKPEISLNPSRGAIRAPSPDPSSIISIDSSIRLGRNPDYLPIQHGRRHASHSPAPPWTFRGRLRSLWVTNKGLALVLIAQLFGTLMNVTTRILEVEGNDGERLYSWLHSVQANVVRQGLPSVPNSLRQDVHHCGMRIVIHVVQEHRTFSMGHERS